MERRLGDKVDGDEADSRKDSAYNRETKQG